jgi:UDP-GlcNAc:undecaprenyl-phosphate/decaprenyl-phosphate GlcNAc-1-phosphate transferase
MVDILFLLFLFSLIFSISLTPFIRNFAIKRGIVDVGTSDRKMHDLPIPRIGGVAIFFSIVFALGTVAVIMLYTRGHIELPYVQMGKIISVSFGIFVVGLIDDIFEIKASIKLLFQVVLAVLVFYLGFKIVSVSFPFAGGVLQLGYFSLPVTVLWYVGVTNAFNLIDGIDGLAAGLALIASSIMIFVSLFTGHILIALMCSALAGSLVGFLRFNIYPASIFMGDSGCMFIGFLLSILSVVGTQKSSAAIPVVVPLLILAVPLLDTTLTISRRVLSGQKIFKPDRGHLHHKLLDKGLNQRTVALILYGVAASLGFYSLLFVDSANRLIGYSLLFVFAILFVGIQRIGYEEFSELLKYISVGLRSQGRQLSNQIQLKKYFSNGILKEKEMTCEQFAEKLETVLTDIGFDDFDFVFFREDEFNKKVLYEKSFTNPNGKNLPHIHLPVRFKNGCRMDLSLYKTNFKKPLLIRFSVLMDDLPRYLNFAFENMVLKFDDNS